MNKQLVQGLVGAAMILGGLWLLWYGLIGHP
jgi:hypothetical protein